MRTSLALIAASGMPALAGPVVVVVDMDAGRPGIQTTVDVPAGMTLVPGVAVYIYDPEATRGVMSIGYIGALDRGIAFGHMRTSINQGMVTSFTAHPGTAANPGNTGWAGPAFDPAFDGPEVQYLESGAGGPGLMPPAPTSPVFTVDVHLSGAQQGDVFRFFLADYVSIWTGGMHGAFTTRAGEWLDTGGDCTLDGTVTVHGTDVDVPVAGGSFPVDYIDGGTGPATITIGRCYANCDASTTPPALNIIDFACFLNRFAAGDLYANCDGSTLAPVLNILDFACFLNAFAAGCT